MMSPEDIELSKFMANVWRKNDERNKKIDQENKNKILPDGKTYFEYLTHIRSIGRIPLSYEELYDVYADSDGCN